MQCPAGTTSSLLSRQRFTLLPPVPKRATFVQMKFPDGNTEKLVARDLHPAAAARAEPLFPDNSFYDEPRRVWRKKHPTPPKNPLVT